VPPRCDDGDVEVASIERGQRRPVSSACHCSTLLCRHDIGLRVAEVTEEVPHSFAFRAEVSEVLICRSRQG
ncbi:MAG: hypothetical protein P8H61_07445, partial [Ilumatobacter sp.]|nr:hypothetical protein [Ilumatobacter sp.]